MTTDEAVDSGHLGERPPEGRPMTADAAPIGTDAPIFAVMSSMQAMRRLRPDPVPVELLHQVIQAATWAGSGSHLQRQSFVVVTDRDQMRKLAGIWQAVEQFYL